MRTRLKPGAKYPAFRRLSERWHLNCGTSAPSMPQYMLAMKMLANRSEDDTTRSVRHRRCSWAYEGRQNHDERGFVALMKECYPGIPGLLDPLAPRMRPRSIRWWTSMQTQSKSLIRPGTLAQVLQLVKSENEERGSAWPVSLTISMPIPA
jgi:hypothetical protein